MVGKIILWVLLALLLLIAGLLSIPVKVRGSYAEGAPFLHIRYGLVRLQLFPRKEEAEKTERKPLKQKKAKSEKQKKPKKQKKPRAKINTDQILYALEKLPPILARALKRTGYDGYLSIEFEGMEDCIQGISVGLANLRRYAEMAG